MPRQRHYYGLNHLHFITSSTYRRARLFDSERFRTCFITTLGALRRELEFRIVGYVLMPEHFHLLIWPTELSDPTAIVRRLKERTAKFILRNLQDHQEQPWCQRMLARVTLPATVHDHARFRVWQRRFYDLNVWSPKKRDEKLTYMHNNPVKRGLATEPEAWPWSSWRFYFLNDTTVLPMDPISWPFAPQTC